jgi:hypothetical protein
MEIPTFFANSEREKNIFSIKFLLYWKKKLRKNVMRDLL